MEEKFGIVIAIGLAIFGIAFVVDNSSGDGFLEDEETPETIEFVDRSYGRLGSTNTDDRVIRFGDFTVGEARGNVLGYRNEKEKVSDSLLGGEKLVFRYNATQPREGNLSFEVLGREGQGEVYLNVNGDRIFSRSMIATGTPEIEVPAGKLKPGINRFEIGVERRSFLGSTEYSLEEIQLRVNDRKFHDHVDTFQLYSYELQDYLQSPLNFNIRNSVKTSPLRVYINDRRVFSRAQVRSQQQVEVTPSNADLTPGANVIRFETERPATYEIENAQLTMRYLGNVDRQNIVFGFELSPQEVDYSGRDDTSSYIRFDYQNLLPSPRPVRIDLNEFNRTFIPDNGRNTIELPEGTLQEENSFSLRTNGTYQVNSLRILSEKGEG